MSKFARWLFWNLAYCFRYRPRELAAYVTRGMRCRWPWWKFRPIVIHNDDGSMWHVYWSDKRSYTIPNQLLPVELHIGDDGQVVGVNIFDESLCRLSKEV